MHNILFFMNLSKILLVIYTLTLQACGGGGQLSDNLLPSPYLYISAQGLWVRIAGSDMDCKYKIKVSDLGKDLFYDIDANGEVLLPEYSMSSNFSYICQKKTKMYASQSSKIISLFRSLDGNYKNSFFDIDNDGFDDLFPTIWTGNGFHIKSLFEWGFATEGQVVGIRDVRFVDLDGDGQIDAVANVYWEDSSKGVINIYWGSNGRFVKDEDFAGNQYVGFGETIVVADFNNDGLVDIFIPQYHKAVSENKFNRNLLFKNLGGRQFSEIAIESEVSLTRQSFPEGAQALDINNDGNIDLYAGGSFFVNLGDFKFREANTDMNLFGYMEEGSKFFDFNHDGFFDLIINRIDYPPVLFVNDGFNHFTETNPLEVNEYFNSSYGVAVADFNQDGHEDLLLGGGRDINGNLVPSRLYFYHNGKYVKQEVFGDLKVNEFYDLVSFNDYNNDGSIDIALRTNTNYLSGIYINPRKASKYVSIDVLGGGVKNQFGRSVIFYFPDGTRKIHAVDGGSGYLGNQSYSIVQYNDFEVNLKMEVRCFNRSIEFFAVSGRYSVDCVSGQVSGGS